MTEQRRSKRFELKLPFQLIRRGTAAMGKRGETRNVSSSGVLFTADADMEVGEPIEYMITLPTSPQTRLDVRLRCLGTVMRLDSVAPDDDMLPQKAVAATLERYEFVREKQSAASN